jgi:sulfopyruvate decarboxylase TPP-binding subunit
MDSETLDKSAKGSEAWPHEIFAILKKFKVRQVTYVPDGGHAELIRQVHADPNMVPVTLTTEEEGVAVLAGAWLGGDRGALLMQSSGVGNCINMLSLVKTMNFPFFALVTMRGALELMGIQVLRATNPGEVYEVVHAGAAMAYGGHTPTAVLLSQRLIGAKVFAE